MIQRGPHVRGRYSRHPHRRSDRRLAGRSDRARDRLRSRRRHLHWHCRRFHRELVVPVTGAPARRRHHRRHRLRHDRGDHPPGDSAPGQTRRALVAPPSTAGYAANLAKTILAANPPTIPFLFALRLFLACRLLRGLQLLHATLQPCQRALEGDDLVAGGAQLLSRLKRVLGEKPLQEIDVALKTTRSLVQPGGLGAVLYPRNVLRVRETKAHRHGKPRDRDFEHFARPSKPRTRPRTAPHARKAGSAASLSHPCGPMSPRSPASATATLQRLQVKHRPSRLRNTSP